MGMPCSSGNVLPSAAVSNSSMSSTIPLIVLLLLAAMAASSSASEPTPAPAPVRLTVDPAVLRYSIHGIGGNYCFNIESPVTRHTLDNLRPAVARTEMSLRLWAARDPGGDPESFDYAVYAASDTPDSRIRRELELMAELQRRKIPYTIAVWRMPQWMVDFLPLPPNASPGSRPKARISEAQWPQVLRAIGTYLLYAREKYGVEPELFTFNEPNIGIDVLFSAEEHRDAIKRLGAMFQRLSLKTRCVLADAATARDTHVYALATAADPEALKYIGAIAFHSWTGARPEQYAAWADLAEKLRLPLHVAEAGVDPHAWRNQDYRTFAYAVRELVDYQELLLHARPQAIMLWEYTGDYNLMATDRPIAAGEPVLTERFCFQKHWCELTPPGSQALATSSDSAEVLITAFRRGEDLTIHISNSGEARSALVEGLPPHLTRLGAVRTAEGEFYRHLPAVSPRDGRVELQLPSRSLTSLSTLPLTEARAMVR